MSVTHDVQGTGAGDAERRLVAAARGGDHRAFEALVLKYQDRIYRLIQRLVSGSDVVDDLAQEVFIRAYRSLGDFKGESSLYTWLYKIALNLCRNHYRTRGRKPAHEELDEADGARGVEAAGGLPRTRFSGESSGTTCGWGLTSSPPNRGRRSCSAIWKG